MTTTTDPLAEAFRKMINQRVEQIANCERMLELLKPEWDKFEARTGHNVYVARDYAEHTSALRTAKRELEALEWALARPTPPELAAFGASDAACYLYPGGHQQAERAAFCSGAAHAVSELAALREALLRWQSYGCPDCGGDCGSANPPVSCCIMEETRAALAATEAHDD